MRDLVILSLHNLVREPDVARAYALLDEWGALAEYPLHKAACHYLIHFVVPAVRLGTPVAAPVPAWVDEALFSPSRARQDGKPPIVHYYEGSANLYDIVNMTYGELNCVSTMSDASFMEKTLLERYRASEACDAMLWHGALERLRNVVIPRLMGEPARDTPYWNEAMRTNMVPERT